MEMIKSLLAVSGLLGAVIIVLIVTVFYFVRHSKH